MLVAAAAVFAAILVSYGIARTVTRPLGAITAAMREMAATGDHAGITLPTGARWEDEDAAAGNDVQYDDRLDFAVSARGRNASASRH